MKLLEKIKNAYNYGIFRILNTYSHIIFRGTFAILQLSFYKNYLAKCERGLFIDCGSNLGQGYSEIKNYFPNDKYDVIMIEPNPNCMNIIKEKFQSKGNIKFIQKAIWINENKLKFYGANKHSTAETASVSIDHSSGGFAKEELPHIEVEALSFSNLLNEVKEKYDKILIKMDIESAEYDVLEDLIKQDTIGIIDLLLVEFHSFIYDKSLRKQILNREINIIKELKIRKIRYIKWM